jgi:hypothetical protein
VDELERVIEELMEQHTEELPVFEPEEAESGPVLLPPRRRVRKLWAATEPTVREYVPFLRSQRW